MRLKSVISEFGKPRQEDYYKFKGSVDYTVKPYLHTHFIALRKVL